MFENLEQFAKDKKKFTDSFNTSTREWSTFITKVTYKPLSKIVELKPKPFEDVVVQLSKIAELKAEPKRIRILVLFVSSHEQELNEQHISLLKNIFNFMAKDPACKKQRFENKVEDLCAMTTL
jgi:nitrate reductase NapAB chaperone NapD